MSCDVAKKNLGISKCTKLPQMFAGMFTTPVGFKIPAATILSGDAAIQAFLQEAILDPDSGVRIFKWPPFVGFEDAKEDAVYEETPLSDLKVRDGKFRWRVYVQQDMCIYRAMSSHNGGNQNAIFFDIENQLFGRTNSDGDFLGFSISLLNVEKLMVSDGSTATKIPIYIVLKNSKQITLSGAIIEADFIEDIVPLTDVTLKIVGSPSATLVKVTVSASCDGTKILGLVAADFILKTAGGAAQTISSLTEAGGVYSLVGTGLVTGTLTLDTPDNLSIEGYESVAPVVVTVT